GLVPDARCTRNGQMVIDGSDANQFGVLFLKENLYGIPSNCRSATKRYPRRYDAMDTDHDEQVTTQEILDYTRKVMRDADLDHDGTTTRQEFMTYIKQGAK